MNETAVEYQKFYMFQTLFNASFNSLFPERIKIMDMNTNITSSPWFYEGMEALMYTSFAIQRHNYSIPMLLTNIPLALKTIYKELKTSERDTKVIFISDGDPSISRGAGCGPRLRPHFICARLWLKKLLTLTNIDFSFYYLETFYGGFKFYTGIINPVKLTIDLGPPKTPQ